jgi:hypothetical protein
MLRSESPNGNWQTELSRVSTVVFVFPVVGGPVSLGLCGGMIYYTADMERKRMIMRALAGPYFQDNEWGFGQVLAWFIWVPLLIRFFEILSVCLLFESKAND